MNELSFLPSSQDPVLQFPGAPLCKPEPERAFHPHDPGTLQTESESMLPHLTPPCIWDSREGQQVGDFREAKAAGVCTDYTTPPPCSQLAKSSRAVFTAEQSGQMAECSAGPASCCKGLQLPRLWVSWVVFYVLFFSGIIIFHCHLSRKGGKRRLQTRAG